MLNLRQLTASAILALFSITTTAAHAGWTRTKGEWFTSQSVAYYETGHFVNDAGQKQPQPTFRKYEYNLYGEYGLKDGLTLGFNTFLHQLESAGPPASDNFGLADTEFFARQKLWEKDGAVLSVQPLIKLPSWYETQANPRGGTNDFDAELRLQGGYGFNAYGRHHFSTLDIAYRHRFGEWRDQLKVDATLGMKVADAITLMPQLFLTKRVEGTARSTNSSSAVNDYDMLKGQFSILYDWNTNTTLQLGVFSHLHVRNTGDGEGVTLGLWYRF